MISDLFKKVAEYVDLIHDDVRVIYGSKLLFCLKTFSMIYSENIVLYISCRINTSNLLRSYTDLIVQDILVMFDGI